MADQVILLLDGSHLAEHAIPAATREAHAHAVPLTLLRPVACPIAPQVPNSHGGPLPATETCTQEVLAPLEEEAGAYVERLRSSLGTAGTIHAVARSGNPLQVVREEIALHHYPIVMVPFPGEGTDRHHGLTETLVMLGQHLIRHGADGEALIQPVPVAPDPVAPVSRGAGLIHPPAEIHRGGPVIDRAGT